MCADLKLKWNSVIRQDAQLTFVDFFYLSMGTPDDHDLLKRRSNGVNGWIIEFRGHPVVLVGPKDLSAITFLNYTKFIEISVHEDPNNWPVILAKMREQSERFPDQAVLFAISAGSLAKILITKGYFSFKKDQFIDTGSAFDGYVGLVTKDFINIRRFCEEEARYTSPDGLERYWMLRSACQNEGISLKPIPPVDKHDGIVPLL